MSERQTRDGQAADRRPSVRRRTAAERRRSVQSVAVEYRIPPRKLLRAIEQELVDAGRPDCGPFQVDLQSAGVHAARAAAASRTTYTVYDASRLHQWFLSGETMVFSQRDLLGLHNLIMGMWNDLPTQGKSRARKSVEHWVNVLAPRLPRQ